MNDIYLPVESQSLSIWLSNNEKQTEALLSDIQFKGPYQMLIHHFIQWPHDEIR